jgi:hypothetical protein
VLISVKPMAAMTSENQPPSSSFNRLAPRKARSMGSIAAPSANTAQPQPQRRRATTQSRMVVISMVAVTAMP